MRVVKVLFTLIDVSICMYMCVFMYTLDRPAYVLTMGLLCLFGPSRFVCSISRSFTHFR